MLNNDITKKYRKKHKTLSSRTFLSFIHIFSLSSQQFTILGPSRLLIPWIRLHLTFSKVSLLKKSYFKNLQITPGYTLPSYCGSYPTDATLVCHLIKSLYGLKQAPREWFLRILFCAAAIWIYTSQYWS